MDEALKYYARFVRRMVGIYIVAGVLYGTLSLFAGFQSLSSGTKMRLTLDVPLPNAAAVIAVNATLVIALNLLVAPLFHDRGHTGVDLARAHIVSWSTYLLATTSIVMAVGALIQSGPHTLRIEALVLVLASAAVVVLTVDLDMAVPQESNHEFADARAQERLSELAVARSYWRPASTPGSAWIPQEIATWLAGTVSVAAVSCIALILESAVTSTAIDWSVMGLIFAFVAGEYVVLLVSFHFVAVALAKRDVLVGSLPGLLIAGVLVIACFVIYSVARDTWSDSPVGAVLVGVGLSVMLLGPFVLAALALTPCLSRAPFTWLQLSLLRRTIAHHLGITIKRRQRSGTGSWPRSDSRTIRAWRHVLQAAGSSRN